MIKEIFVSYSESHPTPGKYTIVEFSASEKYTMDILTPEQYQEEYNKAFSRVQTMVDSQVDAAFAEDRIITIPQ